MLRPAVIAVYALLVLGVSPLAGISFASDRDRPPYMIYIDPETGKYTTRPPEHPDETEPAADENAVTRPEIPEPQPRRAFSAASTLALAGGAALLLVGAVFTLKRKRRSSSS